MERSILDEEFVLRAVREDFVSNGILNPRIFGRRPRAGREVPEKGISVSVQSDGTYACSPESFFEHQQSIPRARYEENLRKNPKAKKPNYYVGVLKLQVGKVRQLKIEEKPLDLDVKPSGLPHALIVGAPILDYEKGDPEALEQIKKAERISNLLLLECTKCYTNGTQFELPTK